MSSRRPFSVTGSRIFLMGVIGVACFVGGLAQCVKASLAESFSPSPKDDLRIPA